MNPNTNEFETETAETPKEWTRFEVGELVVVKGVRMVIEAIEPRRLSLRPETTGERIARSVGAQPAETFTQRLERAVRERRGP